MSTQPASTGVDEARLAYFEREENFRWISSILASTSPVTLNESVPERIQHAVYAFSELSEIAHGSIDPSWILKEDNRKTLGAPGFPLEQYPTLTGELDGRLEHFKLVERFYGTRGTLQGYCCLRMHPRTPAYDMHQPTEEFGTIRPQIVLAFSGTSNARLALYDIMAAPLAYKTAFNHPSKSSWRVHDGFQRVYQGIKSQAFKALQDAITAMEARNGGQPWDLVITAHSLGAAISYLTLLDLLHHNHDPNDFDSEVPLLPKSTNVTICAFGSPRCANTFLVGHFRQLAKEWREQLGREEALTEWSVIGHRDGVPSLPPAAIGYSHFCAHPYYSYGGHLYIIPPSESEHGHFNVDVPEDHEVLHSRGGHNYYGARDMERLQRRMKAIALDVGATTSPLATPNSSALKRRSLSGDTIRHPSGGSGLWRRATARVIRRASWSTNDEAPPATDLPPSSDPSSSSNDNSIDTTPSPEEVENITSDLTVEPEQEWVRRYLEREKKEEDTWQQRLEAQAKPSTLGRITSFRVFSRK